MDIKTVKNGDAVASPELLNYAIENGMIDLPSIQRQIKMNERKRYLEKHNHKKWQSKDGKWNTYFDKEGRDKNRILCKRSTEQELDTEIIKYWKNQEINPTVKEVFDEWNSRRLSLGKIKASTFSRNEDTFKRFFSDFGKRRIKSIDETDWEDFLCECISKYNLKAKAFANLKTIVRGMLKRAKKRKLIDMNVETFLLELDITDRDFKRTYIDDSKEVFMDDEVALIMDYIKANPDIRNIGIALMFVTGIRIGELVTLKNEDFDGMTFKVKRTETRCHPDGSKGYIYSVDDFPKTPAGYRTVIVPDKYEWVVKRFRLNNPFGEFCMTNNRGERLNAAIVRKKLYWICDHLGIERRSPHKIRKTYGSILLDNHLDRKIIEGQMGHTNIGVTERHYHRNRRHLDEKKEIFNSIPEFMENTI